MRLLDKQGMVEEWIGEDEEGRMVIQTREDVTPLLEAMRSKRLQERWGKEMKEDFVHFAKIPTVVELELLKKGINLHDKNHTKAIVKEIQTNYPYLLAHDGKKF